MSLQSQIRPELWQAIAKPYEAGVYKSAILDAIHYLSDVIREKANVEGDGVSLVGQAFGGDSPRLRINKFQTESEKSAQRGIEQILRGIYQGIRNPRSHEQHTDNRDTADAIVIFINFILNIIDQSKGPFVLDEWLERVFDSDLVASERYAKLLVSEIPSKRCSDVLISLFRNKHKGDGGKLKFVFRRLIEVTGEERISDFISLVSDEFRSVKSESSIRTILQILPPGLWTGISEIARLRIENKLIESIRSGKIEDEQVLRNDEWVTLKDNVSQGAFGTWSINIVEHFSLKGELSHALVNKLRTYDPAEIFYVFRFFLGMLPKITERNNVNEYISISAIVDAIEMSGEAIRQEFAGIFGDLPENWQKSILKQLKSLEESDPDFYHRLTSKDIPF